MSVFLGLDTSNYTTSCALYDAETDDLRARRRLLPVQSGQKGLRQSDAVFHHTVQLPGLIDDLLSEPFGKITAVGASAAPRDAEGSYMPCFLVGTGQGRTIAAALGVPFYGFSHQAGHIAAGVYSCANRDLILEPFYAFHISGGTTDLLFVVPDEREVIRILPVAASSDLKAGQLIDRVGVALGLDFPAGPALDRLAVSSENRFDVRPFLRDGCASFSGIENRCRKMIDEGEAPCDVARYCIDAVGAAVASMTEYALAQHGKKKILFVGGVMCNSILRPMLSERFDALFAQPAYSSDNAAGIAYLTRLKHELK